MARVVTIRCTGCSATVYLVRERTADNAWLFEKLQTLGHRLYARHEAASCPGCGQAVGPLALPEGTEDDHWDAMERRGLTVTRDAPFPEVPDRSK